jgi:hypothetical protein
MKRRYIDDARNKAMGMATSLFYKRKITRIAKQMGRRGLKTALSREQRENAKCFLRQWHRRYSDVSWHECYTGATGAFYSDYIPEDIYYAAIEPTLNPPERGLIYEDKNYYDRIGLQNTPQTLARLISGRLLSATFDPILDDDLDDAFASCREEIVIKPAIGSGGGRDVRIVRGNAAKEEISLIRAKTSCHEQNYIVQKFVRQHAGLSEINSTSVNTYRILTLRHEHGISALSTVLRVGRAHARVDNTSAGGFVCGVDRGHLRQRAFDVNFCSYDAHPDSGYVFHGAPAPCVEQARQFCTAMHRMLPDQDLASWDIAVTENEELVLIEVNVQFQSIGSHQLCNGPVFGDHTASVLARIRFHMVGGLVTR